jgi:DNA-binding ferritin-like protein (Dps family)
MKLIDDAIDEKGQTLTELNNVLLNLMSSSNRKLIGLSLKKINQSESANFAYVNKSPKSVEFATVEKIKMSEIDIVIKTEDSVDGMSQGAYIVFDKYRINVIRTPVEGRFSNLKYESKIDGSGGRGGAAPVKLVDDLLKDHSKGYRITFVNKHQEYPQTAEEFYDDSRDYKSMYNSLQKYITGTKSYDEFKSKIITMFDSDRVKNRLVAQSKLMQLHFFSDAIVKNSNDPEFWTDLLYLSLKVGNRFAPHGKLA